MLPKRIHAIAAALRHPLSCGAYQLSAFVLGAGLIASIAASDIVSRKAASDSRLRDQRALSNLVAEIRTRFDLYVHGLSALRNFIRTTTMASMTRRDLEAFIFEQSLAKDYPGMRGIGVIRHVLPAELARFVEERRVIDGRVNFDIKQIMPNEAARFVIQHIGPALDNSVALGLDIASEDVRRAAALRAAENDQPALTAPIVLVQAGEKRRVGLLAVLPVYRPGASTETPSDRLAALEGWTFAPLAIDEVLDDLLPRYRQLQVRIRDFDANPSQPLFDAIPESAPIGEPLAATVEILGRRWTIEATHDPASAEMLEQGVHRYAFAGVFLFFTMLALLVHGRARHLAKESRLGAERSRLADIVARATDGILSVGVDGRIVSWNAAASRMLQFSEAEARGSDVRALLTPEAGPILEKLQCGQGLPDAGLTVKTLCKRKDGSRFPALIVFFTLGGGGRDLGISVRDTTEQQMFEESILDLTHKLKAEVDRRTAQLEQSLALQAEIHHRALHDPLTSLANRLLFRRELVQAVERHALDETQTFAVLALDLDRFKPVNDTYGHPIGDQLLVEVANRLRGSIRAGDMAARLGGDEFAILLQGGATRDEAVATARRILADTERPYVVDGIQIEIGISVGIALHDASMRALDADEFFKVADNGLYEAKRNGRGTYHLCTDMRQPCSHASRLALEMRDSLRNGDFRLVYQPIIDCASGRLEGFEALMRWHHPTRGPIPPTDFIPIAEGSDMIGPLGEWALREACREALNWADNITVAVNVSPAQIQRQGWDRAVIAIVDETGLPPERLVVEVTESVLMADSSEVLARLQNVQDHGIAIALDDFGTGYSSLSYLRKFRFDKLKIDKSFIREAEDVVCAAIIRCVVRIGRMLSLTVVAEGIETQHQLELIHREGCSQAQGYFFSKPLERENARAMIATLRTPQPLPRQHPLLRATG